ncbi:MAG: class I SAM-dependent methyltransferase [Porphyromonadaceae bacterium]|nr:MAG: class I SAM-dependent methyltransferase [Porphyromonadaceae bacterium]
MKLKYQINLPLDSPERTIIHRNLIKSKKFLRKLYEQWYSEFSNEISSSPQGLLLELGSGGGFLKEMEPRVICSDVIDLPTNDMTFSALEMPFEDQSVAAIFMTDAMHHIPDSEKFLQEVNRVLVDNGKLILIEPANSIWGRFIFRNFHHEPFDPRASWTIPSSGPMSGANGALPWIIFVRDFLIFQQKFPKLEIQVINYRNPVLYLVSGGVSYRQLLPDFFYGFLNLIDKTLPKISKQLSMFMLVKITRIPELH